MCSVLRHILIYIQPKYHHCLSLFVEPKCSESQMRARAGQEGGRKEGGLVFDKRLARSLARGRRPARPTPAFSAHLANLSECDMSLRAQWISLPQYMCSKVKISFVYGMVQNHSDDPGSMFRGPNLMILLLLTAVIEESVSQSVEMFAHACRSAIP